MAEGIDAFLKLLAERFADSSSSTAASRERAMATLSMIVGGLVLARACARTNARTSRQILHAVLNGIEKQASDETA